VAVLLLDTVSLHKITQTVLEMLRSGIHNLPISLSVFYSSGDALDTQFCSVLPFHIHRINPVEGNTALSSLRCLDNQSFDYVILFESSGMYTGEEIVKPAALLNGGHFDAIWGSRRLSAKNKYKSYPLYYRYNMALRALRYCGSHMLSLAYLLLYRRYISDA